MEGIIIAGVLILVGIYWFGVRPILRKRHRENVIAQPFPSAFLKITDDNLPVFKHMPSDLQQQLIDCMKVFLDEKKFIGCAGLEITDEVRVTIAAQACLLLLNRKTNYYPHLNSIYVYPSAYIGKESVQDANGIVTEKDVARLGESWTRGALVLAWDHSKGDARNFHDGHNVVIHEFSHQLDQLSGAADGAPVLDSTTSYLSWAKVLTKDYLDFCRKVQNRRKDVFDEYGATNPAEFFAVATETFFEKPKALKERHPELFDELQRYYKVDPIEWDVRYNGKRKK